MLSGLNVQILTRNCLEAKVEAFRSLEKSPLRLKGKQTDTLLKIVSYIVNL